MGIARMYNGLWLVVIVGLSALIDRNASDPALVQEGRALAEANCARCHNLESTGDSPFAPAPPFRIISGIYNSSDLERAFAQGLVVDHPAMPEFRMTAEQASALGAFIDSLGH
jgi:cytochrome c